MSSMPTALSNQAAILCPCHADRQSVAMCIKTHDKWKRVWQEKQPAFMIGAVEPGGKQSLCTVKQHVKVMPPFFALVVQTDGLLPSASDFMTSGDESGGGKSGTQRKRSLKDKPRKSRMKKEEEDADVDTAAPGMLHVPYWHKFTPQK